MRLKIAVCDDDRALAEELSGRVAAWAREARHTAELRVYGSGEEFLWDYDTEKDFDLLLLDIEMAGISGVELAKRLRREQSRAEILFLTSHTEFYGEGYEVDALHYLIKPIDWEKLRQVLEKAAAKLSVPPPAIIVSCEGRTVKLYESEIYYVEAFLHYVCFFTKDGTYRVKEKISDIEERLSGRFFKSHRSYLVSLACIRQISRRELFLENGASIPLARGKYDSIHRAYIDFYSPGQ